MMINKIGMLDGVRNVGPVGKGQILDLQEEKRDLMELSKVAHKAQDKRWMNEIYARMGEIDFILYWHGEEI